MNYHLSRCSMFMASLWKWERVNRIFDPHVNELLASLDCRHKDFGDSRDREWRADLQVYQLSLNDLTIIPVDNALPESRIGFDMLSTSTEGFSPSWKLMMTAFK